MRARNEIVWRHHKINRHRCVFANVNVDVDADAYATVNVDVGQRNLKSSLSFHLPPEKGHSKEYACRINLE